PEVSRAPGADRPAPDRRRRRRAALRRGEQQLPGDERPRRRGVRRLPPGGLQRLPPVEVPGGDGFSGALRHDRGQHPPPRRPRRRPGRQLRLPAPPPATPAAAVAGNFDYRRYRDGLGLLASPLGPSNPLAADWGGTAVNRP